MPPIVLRSRVHVGSMAKERGDGYGDEDGDGAAIPLSSDAIGEMVLDVASNLCVVFLLFAPSLLVALMPIIYRPLHESCSV
jgi:hypothetical protein